MINECSIGINKMIVNISPRKTTNLLIGIILCLTLMHCLLLFIEDGLDIKEIHSLRTFFDFERDSNIPTWYSSITLFISSLLLSLIAIAKKKTKDHFALHWKFLAIIFAFLSLDEVAMFHENSGKLLEVLFPVKFDGLLYFQWVLIGIPVTLIIFLAYYKFIVHLPTKTRNLFILAGALYIGGALGLEILAGHEQSLTSPSHIRYELFTTVEELWEKLGVMVFIYALLSYVEKYLKLTQITIGNGSLSSNQVGLSRSRY